LTGERFEESRSGEREAPARRSGLRWILAGAAVFVVAAIVLVLTVFSGDGGQTAQAGGPAPSTASAGSVQDDAPAAPPTQRPGTVVLPGGGMAKLIHEDVAADGALPIPQNLGDAAWWGAELGAEHGVTLFSGHINWKGQKGPFDELWRLKTGQDIDIADTKGGHWTYRVSEISTIHKDELAARSEELFSQEGPHKLVLATCGGEYIGGTTGYEDNRIVTAALVSRP
jgi:hypothetical protein